MPLPEGRGLDTNSILKLNEPRAVAFNTLLCVGELQLVMHNYQFILRNISLNVKLREARLIIMLTEFVIYNPLNLVSGIKKYVP